MRQHIPPHHINGYISTTDIITVLYAPFKGEGEFTMRINKTVLMAAVLITGLSSPVWAGEKITDPAVVRGLVEGKVYTAHNPGNNVTTKGMLHPGGKATGKSSLGTESEGTWTIESDGELCTRWRDYRWSSGCAALERTSNPDLYTRSLMGWDIRYTFSNPE